MSTTLPDDCPCTELLRGLLSGELSLPEQEGLTRHIEDCPRCQHTLEDWLSSPSVEALAANRDVATDESALRDLLDHVRRKSVGEATQAETCKDHENDLTYLQPTDRPGLLGRLGHYDIQEILGKGGFGIVFKAFDRKLHRVVAIKVLAPELAANGTARKRFIREAQAAAAVKSDHIVAIHNVEDEHQPPYLVMEMIDGITLQGRLDREGPLELKEILRIGMQTAEGLAAAHKQGLVHRDIKPANILLENGVQRVKITDFGLAKVADDASVTQSGVIAGTPAYMSPEQAEGLAIDHRSDLFSLGSVLYVMATGRVPFRAGTTVGVLKRVCEDTPRPIHEVNSEIPDWLSEIITRLHAKKPEARFQKARDVATLLGEKLAELQSKGRIHDSGAAGAEALRSPGAPAKSALPSPLASDTKRSPGWRQVAVATLVLVATGIGLAVYLSRDGDDAPQKETVVQKKFEDPTPSVAPVAVKDGQVQLFKLATAPFDASKAREYQDACARHLGIEVEITNSIGMKLRLIPPGEALIGTAPEDLPQLLKDAEKEGASAAAPGLIRSEPVLTRVSIKEPFYCGVYEVTVAQFRRFVKATGYQTEAEKSGLGGYGRIEGKVVRRPELTWQTPGNWKLRDDQPAVQVSYHDALAFCAWLTKEEGRQYQVPDGVLWEAAARGGAAGYYGTGGGPETQDEVAWLKANLPPDRLLQPQPIGGKRPNAWGLFDALGNAWEWSADNDTRDSSLRIIRGGGWNSLRIGGRVNARGSARHAEEGIGFRVVIVGDLKGKTTADSFVLLARDSRVETRHPTLADAVKAAQSGDTIEIRGDGPFESGPLDLGDKSLGLRAAAGSRPTIRFASRNRDPGDLFLLAHRNLSLEGLNLETVDPSQSGQLVLCRGHLRAANCRLVHLRTDGGVALGANRADIVNCLLHSQDNLSGDLDKEGTYTILNSTLYANHSAIVLANDGTGFSKIAARTVRLSDSTIVARQHACVVRINLRGNPIDDELKTPLFAFESSRCLLVIVSPKDAGLFGVNLMFGNLTDGAALDLIRRAFIWSENENLYNAKAGFGTLGNFDGTWGPHRVPLPDLVKWHEFWKITDSRSRDTAAIFENGNRVHIGKIDPSTLQPADFRLAPESPGKGAGLGGKDLGAHVDLIGPGAAYERFRATPAYLEWQNQTAELLRAK